MAKITPDKSKFSESRRNRLADNSSYTEGVNAQGYLGESIIEPSLELQYDRAESEIIVGASHNAYVKIGRDRPSTIVSGYGGRGAANAACIDLCAGLASSAGFDRMNKIVSPNMFNDAARIYISQKTDIDKNFGLAETGIPSKYSKARSGIAIKADKVRIIGREGVRIVTGKALAPEGAGAFGESNALGGDIISVNGIELIAGNITDDSAPQTAESFADGIFEIKRVQPIPMGDNLVSCLESLAKYVDQLSNNVQSIANAQAAINTRLVLHTHIATGFGAPTGPGMMVPFTNSTKTLVGNAAAAGSIKAALTAWRGNYTLEDSKQWICSRWNKTNG